MKTTVQGVMFDVDGTLVDSNDAHARAWVDAFSRHHFQVPYERVRRLIGMGGDNLLPQAVGVEQESDEGKKLSDAREKIFRSEYLPHLQPFPGTRELVQRVREKGYEVAVASSSEKELLAALLEVAKVKDLIHDVTSSDDAENSKPDPDIIRATLEKMGCRAEEVVLIGDTPYDIEAAGKAGVRVLAFRCGGWDDTSLAGAVAVYDGPAELLARFDDSPLNKS